MGAGLFLPLPGRASLIADCRQSLSGRESRAGRDQLSEK
jgi:hypothetical protein